MTKSTLISPTGQWENLPVTCDGGPVDLAGCQIDLTAGELLRVRSYDADRLAIYLVTNPDIPPITVELQQQGMRQVSFANQGLVLL